MYLFLVVLDFGCCTLTFLVVALGLLIFAKHML